jgi:4-amino-4-deoxy-L-arabinose transferase-like glycosyltransferase
MMQSAEKLIGAWYDDPRALNILVVLFVLAWTAFHVIAYAPIALHPDIVEVYAWARHPSLGYYKHPPLGAWMAAAWFAVFPTSDWAFHLFAMVNAAVGLFAVGLIARRYLGYHGADPDRKTGDHFSGIGAGDKWLVAVLLLLLTPFYQFHGQRFGSSQVLLSTWPIATLCFLRAFETRSVAWSAAAGAAAGLTMLGKYYSIYLIAAFVVAALMHPKRWDYLRSLSPWISALAGLAVLAPHIYWLLSAGAQTFDYATGVHGGDTTRVVIRKALEYIPGSLAFVLAPLVVYVVLVRPTRRLLAATFWPDDPDRRMLVVLLALPLLLPVLTLPLFGISITSLWSLPAWFLLPVVLLAPPEVAIARSAAVRVALLVLAVTLACLIAAPALAWYRHVGESKEARASYPALSLELTKAWRQATGEPLTIVGGDMELTPAVTFYSPDHPDSIPGFNLALAPWITPERLGREGVAAVCRAEDRACYDGVMAHLRDRVASVVHYQTASRFLGQAGAPARFVFVLAPPKK